ncbi:MAG: lysophospholipase [Acidimicrobiia bacterium]|nr:lysophospholipase [Acidimicrobiia bacterium]
MNRPTFATADNVLLAGHRSLADGTPRGAVVLAHGFSSTAEDPAVTAVAVGLNDAGFDVITYDARGHGGSEGESTLGDLEEHDVGAAVTEARTRSEFVVLVGASMGGIAVLRYAASHADIDGVVSVSTPARWQLPRTPTAMLTAGITRTRLGRHLASRYLRVRVAQKWNSPDPPIDLIPKIGAPVALIHGTRDRFIPASAAEDLFDVASEPRQLRIVEHMGHAFDEAAVPAVIDAVNWTVESVPVPAALRPGGLSGQIADDA